MLITIREQQLSTSAHSTDKHVAPLRILFYRWHHVLTHSTLLMSVVSKYSQWSRYCEQISLEWTHISGVRITQSSRYASGESTGTSTAMMNKVMRVHSTALTWARWHQRCRLPSVESAHHSPLTLVHSPESTRSSTADVSQVDCQEEHTAYTEFPLAVHVEAIQENDIYNIFWIFQIMPPNTAKISNSCDEDICTEVEIDTSEERTITFDIIFDTVLDAGSSS